jgi:hypothetical protein
MPGGSMIRGSLIACWAEQLEEDLEAASGFEPLHRGFADLSLNRLGTPPWNDS